MDQQLEVWYLSIFSIYRTVLYRNLKNLSPRSGVAPAPLVTNLTIDIASSTVGDESASDPGITFYKRLSEIL